MSAQRMRGRFVVAAVWLLGSVVAGLGQTPVIRWTFDGTPTNSGSAVGSYSATLAGTASYTDGIDGQGLRLDGAGYASVAYQLPSQGAIALWFKPDLFYNYNSVFDNSVHADQWEMWFYSDARLRVRIANSTGGDIT